MTVTEAIAALTRNPGRRFHLDLSIIVRANGTIAEVEWTYSDSVTPVASEPSLAALVTGVVARLTTPADTRVDLDVAGVGSVEASS